MDWIIFSFVVEVLFDDDDDEDDYEFEVFFWELMGVLRDFLRFMWCIFFVIVFMWIVWFLFFFFDMDWMGCEVYGGELLDLLKSVWYYDGVYMGFLGLLLNFVVLGLLLFVIDFVCRKLGFSYVWGIVNMIMVVCFGGIGLVILVVFWVVVFVFSVGLLIYVIYFVLVIFLILGIFFVVIYLVLYLFIVMYIEKVGGG